eukprot:1418588-Amphidinium_carterae.1
MVPFSRSELGSAQWKNCSDPTASWGGLQLLCLHDGLLRSQLRPHECLVCVTVFDFAAVPIDFTPGGRQIYGIYVMTLM